MISKRFVEKKGKEDLLFVICYQFCSINLRKIILFKANKRVFVIINPQQFKEKNVLCT